MLQQAVLEESPLQQIHLRCRHFTPKRDEATVHFRAQLRQDFHGCSPLKRRVQLFFQGGQISFRRFQVACPLTLGARPHGSQDVGGFRQFIRQYLLALSLRLLACALHRRRAARKKSRNLIYRKRRFCLRLRGLGSASLRRHRPAFLNGAENFLRTISQRVYLAIAALPCFEFLKGALNPCQHRFQREPLFFPRFHQRPIEGGEQDRRGAALTETLLDFGEVVEVIFQSKLWCQEPGAGCWRLGAGEMETLDSSAQPQAPSPLSLTLICVGILTDSDER